MSQYSYEAIDTKGRHLQISTGWDRPLRYFFLVIEELGVMTDDYVFTNLALSNPGMTLEQVKATCTAHGVPLPEDIEHRLEEDAVHDLVDDHGFGSGGASLIEPMQNGKRKVEGK